MGSVAQAAVHAVSNVEEALGAAKVVSWLDLQKDFTSCTLSWCCAGGDKASLSVAAELATNDGFVIGSVHGLLREHAVNVDNQFRECGVTHTGPSGSQSSSRTGEECISLELNKLANASLVDMVFLTIHLQ